MIRIEKVNLRMVMNIFFLIIINGIFGVFDLFGLFYVDLEFFWLVIG